MTHPPVSGASAGRTLTLTPRRRDRVNAFSETSEADRRGKSVSGGYLSLSDFAYGGQYPHDDQLDDFKDCISAACSCARTCLEETCLWQHAIKRPAHRRLDQAE